MAAKQKTRRFNFTIFKSRDTEYMLIYAAGDHAAITGRLTGRAELNKVMLCQIYAVNNADPNAQGLKFIEICRDKRGWHLKPRHFVVVEGISSLQCF